MKKQLFLITLISLSAASIIKGHEIHDAIKKGNIKHVQQLIDTYGPEVALKLKESHSQADRYIPCSDCTPLHMAAWYNRVEIAELIIEEGGPEILKIKRCNDGTPLHMAAERNRPEIARLIVEKVGPRVLEIQDINGYTALHIAAKNNRPEIATLIVKKGGLRVLGIKDNWGNTPLICAAQHRSAATGRVIRADEKSAEYEEN